MEIKTMFSENRMSFNLKAKTKADVLEELISILDNDGKLKNKEAFIKAVLKREEEFSTGIGMGIAIPHGKDSSVIEPCLTFGISKEGIDFDSLDGKPAHIFFLISVPEESSDTHLQILSYVSRKLMHEDVRQRLLNAMTFEEVVNAFN
ncbi:PTS system fructose-specific EIIABC component [Caloramator mitchellensis]|uniref:PTS system fructose-specific EIIABC component n=1 Tax=Caloramator mitchellensis TaxID=908809 RepID=A0A0R3JYW2_CALMK|nr:PTS sugar transporter subunit IIA [Caloramator mitchellensis]KRQ86156.1 PTS system fructose-specific EIIABC component [Caloramator mitchellensis]